jgi:foldase protein PrsA
MKNVKKLVSAALVGIFLFSFTGCNMVKKTEEGIKKSAVAKIDGKIITRGQLDGKLESVISDLKEQYGEDYDKIPDAKDYLKNQRTQTLNSMINDMIIENKAIELNVMPNDEELKEAMKKNRETMKENIEMQIEMLKQSFKTEEEFKEFLKSKGETEESIKELKGVTEDLLRANVITKRVYDEVIKDVVVEEEAMKNYYEANKESFQEKPNRVHSAHILVETKEEADEIKKQLDDGTYFETLAKEKSLDVATKEQGGDLGWINYKDMNQGMVFMLAAKTLNKGEISDPVQEKDGWHILKIIEKETYEPKAFEEVKDDINKTLLSQEQNNKWQTTFTEWNKEAKIKKYEKNLN